MKVLHRRQNRRQTQLLLECHEDDSNSSCQSTISAVPLLNAKTFVVDDECDHTNATKACVRFDEQRNETNLVAANANNSDQCWYTPTELYSFKKYTAYCAKKVIKDSSPQNCKYQRVMTSVYSCCTSAPAGFSQEQQALSSILCDGDQIDLKRCMETEIKRLGIDRLTISIIREDSRARRTEIVQNVLKVQAEYAGELGSCNPATKAFRIRNVSMMSSQTHRLFAREVAQALSEAIIR